MLFNSVEYLIILPMMLNLESTKISMLSRCKHIFHFEIVAMMMGFASCTSWREAKTVIAEADRLLGM